MSKPDLVVDFCSYQAAKYAVEKWHYSGAIPYASKMVKFGVWEFGVFIGAILYSWGANKNMLSPYGLNQGDGCELVRVAISEHLAPVSQIVSSTIRAIKKHSPGLRLVVSYADTRQEHVGIIYQAMNWVYSGETKGTDLYKVNGRVVHRRQASALLGSIKGLKGEYSGDKHKYLYPLDRAMRRQIAPLAHPYPKKSTSPPVNGDDITTSNAERFDPDSGA